MDSTFSRATVGFFALTLAVTCMALVALWALEQFAGGVWWASLLVVLVALVAEISIYMSTLHEPIYDWIKEPAKRKAEEKEKRREEERHRREMEREAEANKRREAALKTGF